MRLENSRDYLSDLEEMVAASRLPELVTSGARKRSTRWVFWELCCAIVRVRCCQVPRGRVCITAAATGWLAALDA